MSLFALREPGQPGFVDPSKAGGPADAPPGPAVPGGWPFILTLVLLGLVLRVACFAYSTPIRFSGDLDNAWAKGQYILAHGLTATYDPRQGTGIDYPPLRAYIKTGWVAVARALYGPHVARTDAIVWPMLVVNAIFGLAGAAGMYRLCRLAFGRRASLLAAACFWFNPALIFDAWCYVQWDAWGAGPMVWALWALFRRRYGLTGLLLGAAAMLKGQMLLAAPWFLILTLVGDEAAADRLAARALLVAAARGLGRMARLAAGFAAAVLLVTLPFTLEGSANWLNVYIAVPRHLPLASGALNLPHIMEFEYLWTAEDTWRIHAGAETLALSLATRLKVAYALWLGCITLLTYRARHKPERLLGLGLCFAAMFAIAPGMHERYGLWAAALLAPAVCLDRRTATVAGILGVVAFLAPLYTCLRVHPHVAVGWRMFLEASADYWGWLWVAGALWFTCRLARATAVTVPADRLWLDETRLPAPA